MSGNRSKSAFFEGGWVTLSADFRGKGASPTNHCWCQKTRVVAVSCGIKIFAVRCLVFSQYTHLTDRRTDRRTDGRTELRQQYRALHYMQSHGKNTFACSPQRKPQIKRTLFLWSVDAAKRFQLTTFTVSNATVHYISIRLNVMCVDATAFYPSGKKRVILVKLSYPVPQ